MANDGLITEVVSKQAIQELQNFEKQLLSVFEQINKFSTVKINLPSQLATATAGSASSIQKTIQLRQQSEKVIERERLAELKLQADREKAFIKAEVLIRKKEAAQQKSALIAQQSAEKERLSEIKLLSDREKAFDIYEKRRIKEIDGITRVSNEYNKIQSEIRELTGLYNDLSAKKERGINLTEKEETALFLSTLQLQKNQGILQKIDAQVGKYQRNVGNYASGFNGLSNSINQITREFPAFTFSAQTGILALSNNIPILFDNISQLITANKALIAQGKPVTSVFKQVVSSLFSWNTALSLLVTAATIFGDKIGVFFNKIFKSKEYVNVAEESLKSFIKTSQEYNDKSAQLAANEVNRLNLLIATAESKKVSDESRQKAIEELQTRYPKYLANLKQEDILSGNAAKAINSLRDALVNRAKAMAIQELLGENLQKQFKAELEYQKTLQKSVETSNLYDIQQQKSASNKGKLRLITDEENSSLENLRKTQEKSRETIGKVTIQQLSADNVRVNSLIPLKEEEEIFKRILQQYIGYIDVVSESTKAKEKELVELTDFNASAYELNKLRLENELSIQERIFNDESQNLERREVALKAYHEIQRQLADNALAESLRINDIETDNEIKAIQKRVKEKEITEKNGNAVIYSIRKDAEYKNLIAYEQYAEALRGIDISIVESMKGVADAINFKKGTALIDERELEAMSEYSQKLNEIVKGNKDYREIQQAAKDFELAKRNITKANIQLEIDRIETEMRGLEDTEANVSKRFDLEKQLREEKKKTLAIDLQVAEEQAAALEKLQKATESYLNSFTSGAFASFGLPIIDTLTKIEENGKSVFQNLIDGANTTGEKFAVVFSSSLEVAQQFYNALQQYNNQRFEREYANEERAYNIATQFYAKTDAARQELDRQYEEKRREIKRRELQAQKEQAIFNAIINTAQAVVAALATGPQGIALAAVVGAIGAAQIALISSQQIPAYKDGVNNAPGGLSLVGDGGRSEIIKTPSGDLFRTPANDTLVNLPKGSNVYRSEADFIRKHSGALFNSPAVDWQGGRVPTAKEIGIELGNQIKNMPTSVANFDKAGFNSYVSNGHGKKTTFDNKVTMKGLRIK